MGHILNALRRGNASAVCALILAALVLSAGTARADATQKRVLIVTTDPGSLPSQTSTFNGEYVVADLAAAGYPFDVITYSRFVGIDSTGVSRGSMSLDSYDVVFVCGHPPTWTPLSAVLTTCRQAIDGGKKLFLYGDACCRRYDASGTFQVEYLRYALTLFGVGNGTWASGLSGTPVVPADLEKDPAISEINWPNQFVRDFSFTTEPAYKLTFGGKCLAFVNSQGGALDTSNSHFFSLLDYGKITAFLRSGNPATVGFANDRIRGQHVVSFEVHQCGYNSTNLSPIYATDTFSRQFSAPLTNLLVYETVKAPAQAAVWNSITTPSSQGYNPLMLVGGHSRTHPTDWTTVPNVLYESTVALADQRKLIPATTDFFNFSGYMNPTTAQINQMAAGGLIYGGQVVPPVVFGGSGYDPRRFLLPGNQIWHNVQRIPTNTVWFANLAASSIPFCLSATLTPDFTQWNNKSLYLPVAKEDFDHNIKHGMYSYGQLHGVMIDPNGGYVTQGIPSSTEIAQFFAYIKTQPVIFIPTPDLVARLQDFIAGSIDYEAQADGSLLVRASRPGRTINQVKVQARLGLVPTASGDSVITQTLVGDYLYVDLMPETTSIFRIDFIETPPSPPVLTAPAYTDGDLSAVWAKPAGPWNIAEYQCALGSYPGGSDVVGWTSCGSEHRCDLKGLPLQQGQAYFLSVKAKSSAGLWSARAISPAITADLVPPVVSDLRIIDEPTGDLILQCSATASIAPIAGYKFSLGSLPASSDLGEWTTESGTLTVARSFIANAPSVYATVEAVSAAELWSAPVTAEDVAPTGYVGNVAGARLYQDGTRVTLCSVFVTASFDNCIFVEQYDRTAGMKIETASPLGLSLGQLVQINGRLGKLGGERTISRAQVSPVAGSSTTLKALSMPCNAVGGGALNAANPGVTGGAGLYNIGLLVKVCGRSLQRGQDCFYVNDGSIAPQVSGTPGLKILWNGTGIPDDGRAVLVTGVVDVETDGQIVRPVLRPRIASDIVSR